MITSFVNTMCDFSFRGRATRKEFISFIVMTTLISVMLLTLIMILGILVLQLKFEAESGMITMPHRMRSLGILPFIILVLTTVSFIIFNTLAAVMGALLAIRRLHDINCSGVGYWIWFASIIAFATAQTSILTMFLLYFIIGGIIFLAIKESFPYENKYGRVEDGKLVYKV